MILAESKLFVYLQGLLPIILGLVLVAFYSIGVPNDSQSRGIVLCLVLLLSFENAHKLLEAVPSLLLFSGFDMEGSHFLKNNGALVVLLAVAKPPNPERFAEASRGFFYVIGVGVHMSKHRPSLSNLGMVLAELLLANTAAFLVTGNGLVELAADSVDVSNVLQC